MPSRTNRRTTPLRRFLARISIRLLAFNVLLVFLPVTGLFYLDTFEEQLRQAQERTMVQQGRLLAAALETGRELDAEVARQILLRLEQRSSARLRILDRQARLLADSSTLGPQRGNPSASEPEPDPQESWLYRIGALPFRTWDRLRPRPAASHSDFYQPSRPFDGPEVRDALAGRYGANTRISPAQRSVVFYSAIPIRRAGEVGGVVLVSQSTAQILQDLDQVRLAIFKLFLGSVAVAAVLSLLLSTTIARPLRRLRRETAALLDSRGRLTGHFGQSTRLDEIGDLNRALRELASRLSQHLGQLDSFVADLSHEFKNPLASIRSATEVLAEIDDPAERQRFLRLVEGDIARLENLLSALREVTLIDLELEREVPTAVVVNDLLEDLVEGWRLRAQDGVRLELELPDEAIVVGASPERLAQVVENLLDNAMSFAPESSAVRIVLKREGDEAVLTVLDEGPGIPDEHLGRVFRRFFSYRSSKGQHTGLGLAIVKTIVEGYGGSVTASNRRRVGTAFEVRLPIRTAGSSATTAQRLRTSPASRPMLVKAGGDG